ncbi:hypothetical protein VNO77_19882 [Canavalia gladiata]|uniref:Uncharacterized protein n=1 Tax=Canavalia gladiata TaxID=3824 RepID=A0AAN9QKW9_CANGL
MVERPLWLNRWLRGLLACVEVHRLVWRLGLLGSLGARRLTWQLGGSVVGLLGGSSASVAAWPACGWVHSFLDSDSHMHEPTLKPCMVLDSFFCIRTSPYYEG